MSDGTGDKDSDGELLRVLPSSILNFVKDGDEYVTSLELQNTSTLHISYKMKTTTPEKFRVRPSVGVLSPGEHATIVVTILPGFHIKGFSKDKFLVMSLPVDSPSMSSQNLLDLWKNSAGHKGVKQHRLRCTEDASGEVVRNGGEAHFTSFSSDRHHQSVDNKLSSELAKLLSSQSRMQEDIKRTQMLLYIVVSMIVGLGAVLYYIIKAIDTSNTVGSCPGQPQL